MSSYPLQARAELERRRRAGTNKPIWEPHPDNASQCLAYELAQSGEVDEIGYGGQAGGGKTDTVLGIAGMLFERSMIVRREYAQLEGIIDRGNEIYPVEFVGSPKRRWQWDNHIITLRSMPQDKSWKKFQGNAQGLIAVEEAAEFPGYGIRAITGWVRARPGERTLVIFTFNPPSDSEGEWIIQYFAPWLDEDYPNPAKSGEIRYMVHLPREGSEPEQVIEVSTPDPYEVDGEWIYPIRRTFIAASRFDNPYLGEEYERRLDALPEPLRTMVKTGRFNLGAQDDVWQVLPSEAVKLAQARHAQGTRPASALRAYAVDVARGGADKTTIAKLYETWFEVIEIPGSLTPDGPAVAREVIKALDGENAPGGIDVIGVGASAYDSLKQMPGITITPINFGAAAKRFGQPMRDKSKKFTFANLRAAVYWKFAEALDPASGQDIALDPDRSLRAELCAARYEIVAGRIKLEEKEQIKARLQRSPDRADAIVMAWFIAARPILVAGGNLNE